MSTGLKANVDGSAAIQVGGVDAITLTSAGAASFVTSPMTIQGGSASAPSLTFSGDTNTGIFSPAADTIAIGTGGTEALRVNSSQSLLLNTTSAPAASAKMKIATSARTGAFFDLTATGGENWIIDSTNTTGSTDVLGIYANGATGLYLQDTGNVGVGTTSPTAASSRRGLVLRGNANGAELIVQSTSATDGTSDGFSLTTVGTDAYLFNRLNGFTAFATNNTERARITSGGEVYIAGTTDQGAYNLQCNGTGVWGAGAYVNGSDARIKDDIAPIASGLDVVTKLNPVTYRYKKDWSKDQSVQTGFVAQELLTALEGQVYIDGVVQQGGSEGYYSVAYQNIIPILTKAIQELKAELDATKAEVALLKGAA